MTTSEHKYNIPPKYPNTFQPKSHKKRQIKNPPYNVLTSAENVKDNGFFNGLEIVVCEHVVYSIEG